jgi:hypothetical protein
VHTLHHRRKRAGKKSGGGRIFVLGGYSASRIFFRRIFGAINFFGGGGQIRRLGGLAISIHYIYIFIHQSTVEKKGSKKNNKQIYQSDNQKREPVTPTFAA